MYRAEVNRSPRTVIIPAVVVGMLLSNIHVLGADKTWDGEGGNTNWYNDLNWDPNGMPALIDNVTIGSSDPIVEITFSNFDAEADVLNVQSGLRISGDQLTIGSIASIMNLDLFPGSKIIANTGASVSISGISSSDRGTLKGEGDFINQGTLSIDPGSSSRLYLETLLENSDTFVVEAGATLQFSSTDGNLRNSSYLNLQNSATPTYIWGDGDLENVSGGTIAATGEGTSIIEVTNFLADSGSTLSCEDGVLQVISGWNNIGGTISVSSGGMIEFFTSTGGDRTISATSFLGEGTIRLGHDTINLTGAAIANVGTGLEEGEGLLIENSVELQNTLTNNQLLTTRGADIEVTSGNLTNNNAFIAEGSDLNLALTGGNFVNHGNFVQRCDIIGIGPGIFKNESDGTLTLEQNNSVITNPSGQNAGVIENRGTIVVTDPPGSAAPNEIKIPLNMYPGSTVQVEISDGVNTLELHTGGTWTGGEFNVGELQRLWIKGNSQTTYAVNGDVTSTGLGTLSSLIIGDQGQSPTIDVQGELTLSIFSQFMAGTFSGSGTVKGDNIFNWNGGIIDCAFVNNGALHIQSGSTLSGLITNNGHISQTHSFTIDGGQVVNQSTWRLYESTASIGYTGSGGHIINNGLIDTWAGASTDISDMYAPFDNNGTVHAILHSIRFLNTVAQLDPVTGRLTGGEWITEAGTQIIFQTALKHIVGPTSITGSPAGFPQWDLQSIEDGGSVRTNEDSSTSGDLDVTDSSQLFIEKLFNLSGNLRSSGGSTVSIEGEESQLDVSGTTTNGEPDSVVDDLQGIVVPSDITDGGQYPTLITTLLDNYARFVPGGHDMTGPLRIVGDVISHDNATLLIEIAGLTPVTEYDQLLVEDGDITLAGILDVTLLSGYQPMVGDQFRIIDIANGEVLGAFSNVTGDGQWQVDNNTDHVLITYQGAGNPCTGDLTGDEQVNIDDIFAVLGLWGNCPDPCPPYCTGDLTEDCTVNIDDIFAILGLWGLCE